MAETPEWRDPFFSEEGSGGQGVRRGGPDELLEMKLIFRSSSLPAMPSFWAHPCVPAGHFVLSCSHHRLGDYASGNLWPLSIFC